jgi:dihydrofolate reductase
MAKVKVQIAMSLDGFAAGADQSEEHPLGVGGMQLHEWALELAAFKAAHGGGEGEVNASTPVVEKMFDNVGAVVMGRNMFGPIRGDWGDQSWNGWWGEDPPYHVPVFVLTHHAREPLEMEGGTTFHFATEGIEAALEQAKRAAAGADVLVSGGASTVGQYLKAGLIDELTISLVPVILGAGERLLTGLDDAAIKLEQTRSIEAPGVTHLFYVTRK